MEDREAVASVQMGDQAEEQVTGKQEVAEHQDRETTEATAMALMMQREAVAEPEPLARMEVLPRVLVEMAVMVSHSLFPER